MGRLYWLWRRISDFCTSADVLEWFGWRAAVGTLIASIAATISTSLSGAPWYYSLLAGLSALLVGLGLANLYSYYKYFDGANTHNSSTPDSMPIPSPLKIEFDETEPVRWLTEMHPLFKAQPVERKYYGVNVYNSGDMNIENVSVEVERIEQIPDRPDEIVPISSTLGLRLKFKSGETRALFPPKFRDRVPIISHVNSMMVGDKFRMASTQAHEFHHSNRRHRLFLKVTGSKIPAITETFTVWVNEGGDLQMRRG